MTVTPSALEAAVTESEVRSSLGLGPRKPGEKTIYETKTEGAAPTASEG